MGTQKTKAIRTRRTFNAEYKVEAVQRAEERRALGVPITQIARELGITAHLLRTWKRQAGARHGARATEVFSGHGNLSSDEAEVRHLEREVRRLTQENALLKTAAYFAKESR